MARNTGSLAAVFNLLSNRRGNWVTTHELQTVGGPGALRRVRDIRAERSLTIETRRIPGSRQWEYRAATI